MHKPILSDPVAILECDDDFLFLNTARVHGGLKFKTNLYTCFVFCMQCQIDNNVDLFFLATLDLEFRVLVFA